VPLALLVVAGLLGLLRRVGLDLGAAPGVLLLLVLPVGVFALSMALDGSGGASTGQVIDKSERVRVKPEGDWTDDLRLSVRFADGVGAMSTANMLVDGRHFARVAIGDPFGLKVLPLRYGLSVVRPADVSTRSLAPTGVLEWGIPAAALLFLGLRLRRRPVRILILSGLALVALSYPLVSAEQRWRERDDLRGATQRTSATVVESTHVTEINVLPNDVHDDFGLNRHTVPQPYDVVQLELPAAGYPGQVTAVDAIDASTAGSLLPGQLVSVVYAPDDPHDARLEGRARTHYLKTTLGVYTDVGLYAAALIALLLLGLFVQRKYRKR
jgi:hypothetical protein